MQAAIVLVLVSTSATAAAGHGALDPGAIWLLVVRRAADRSMS